MVIKFTKMHGLGNDFVVLDLLAQNIRLNKTLIRRLADRHFGIGCDQVLLVEHPQSPDADFRYRIFNQDGNEVEHCGNGVRCFAKYVYDRKLTGKREIVVETSNNRAVLELQDDGQIRVNMGVPRLSPDDIPFIADAQDVSYALEHKGKQYDISAVSMGNPHMVMFVDDMRSLRINKLGRSLSRHERFPEQVNVGFARIRDEQNFDLRVVERGVGETLACGTGACAAFVSARLRNLLTDSANAHLKGGVLKLEWRGEGEPVFMTGPAMTVFEGQIRL